MTSTHAERKAILEEMDGYLDRLSSLDEGEGEIDPMGEMLILREIDAEWDAHTADRRESEAAA